MNVQIDLLKDYNHLNNNKSQRCWYEVLNQNITTPVKRNVKYWFTHRLLIMSFNNN